MARTLEMFDKPRKPRQWLMHVSDAGGDGPDDVHVRYECQRCGHETGWMMARTVTEAKRGIPCPTCNVIDNAEARGSSRLAGEAATSTDGLEGGVK